MIYDCLGVELPESVKGYPQVPLEGVSLRSTFEDADAPTPKDTAVLLDARLARDLAQGLEGGGGPPGGAVGLEPLRRGPLGALRHRGRPHGDARPGRASTPSKLRELVDLWYHEAGRYNGLPLDDRPRSRSCARSARS